jgi:hypothetical protein
MQHDDGRPFTADPDVDGRAIGFNLFGVKPGRESLKVCHARPCNVCRKYDRFGPKAPARSGPRLGIRMIRLAKRPTGNVSKLKSTPMADALAMLLRRIGTGLPSRRHPNSAMLSAITRSLCLPCGEV